jgi:hypothetical protein
MKNNLLSVLATFFFCVIVQAQDIPVAIQKAYSNYQSTMPAEKIFISTDRTLYENNEMIWLKGFVLNHDLTPSDKSEILYVELLSPKGAVLRRLNLRKNGQHGFRGDFQVSGEAVGGIYTIRAYTNWLRNWGEDYYFEKKITVQKVTVPKLLMQLDFVKEAYGAGDWVEADLKVREVDNSFLANHSVMPQIKIDGKLVKSLTATTNDSGEVRLRFQLPQNLNTVDGLVNVIIGYEGTNESISRSIPIVLNNLTFDVFPEGGYLLHGMKNRVAFKALNEFGKPADITGKLVNSKGKTIVDFESLHQGLGSFVFTPKKGEDYKIVLKSPSQQTFKLPKILKNGIGMRKTAQSRDNVSFDIYSSQAQKLYVIAEINGKIYHRKTINGKIYHRKTINGKNGIYSFKTNDLPVGIMKLTIFDEQLRPQAERLVFVNRHRNLNIKVSSPREKYIPRETVGLNIKVTDDAGKPVQGHFSIAVINDKELIFADDKQDNILSGLLMSSELKGKIHEPNYYFQDFEGSDAKGGAIKKAVAALDAVMMTHGWRRFGWREILDNDAAAWATKVKYPKDKLTITGVAKISGEVVGGATVYLKDAPNIKVKTKKDGSFTLPASKIKPPNYNYRNNMIIAEYRGLRREMYINWNHYNYEIPVIESREAIANVKATQKITVAAVEDDEEKVIEPNLVDKNLASKSVADPNIVVRGQATSVAIQKMSASQVQMAELSISSESIALSDMVVVGYATVSGGEQLAAGYGLDVNVDDWSAPYLTVHLNYQSQNFYTGRNFSMPRYYQNNRNNYTYYRNRDKRKTLYWNAYVSTNANGIATANFYASDENTTFRAIVEGTDASGKVGRGEHTFYVESPFVVEAKAPKSVTTGDKFVVSVLMKNNTNKPITIKGTQYVRNQNHYFRLAGDARQVSVNVPANSFIRKEIQLDANNMQVGTKYAEMQFNSPQFQFAQYFLEPITVISKGFHLNSTFSNRNVTSKTYTVDLDDFETGSLKAEFRAYPNVLGSMMDGVKGIIREPHGCFEQVSSSNYPNIFALLYLNEMNVDDPKTKKDAKKFLSKGYAKLAGYECIGGGFDWYGQSPANMRLTAYGLLQFIDMKKVYRRVDQSMINRTAAWIVDKRDGKGGWSNGNGYYSYRYVNNAYVTYAMSVYGKIDVSYDVEVATKEAIRTKDWYRLSLAAMSNWHIGNKKKANEVLDILIKEVKKGDLLKPNVQTTMSYSYGRSRNNETLGMMAQAIMTLKRKDYEAELNNIILRISQTKTRYGFGSTQATIQALKAMYLYAKNYNNKEKGNHYVSLYANGRYVQRFQFNEKTTQVLYKNFSQFLRKGKNTIKVEFSNHTKNPLPYAVNMDWTTMKPASSPNCKLDLTTKLKNSKAKIGETVRLTTEIQNTSDEFLFNPIALIGIPSGLSLQPWQLKKLQEEKAFDYYEIQDNYLVMYFRDIDKKGKKTINLDLKADFAGEYTAPASSAYLYYGAEDKDWESGVAVSVR